MVYHIDRSLTKQPNNNLRCGFSSRSLRIGLVGELLNLWEYSNQISWSTPSPVLPHGHQSSWPSQVLLRHTKYITDKTTL
jgi:hypothetical protein